MLVSPFFFFFFPFFISPSWRSLSTFSTIEKYRSLQFLRQQYHYPDLVYSVHPSTPDTDVGHNFLYERGRWGRRGRNLFNHSKSGLNNIVGGLTRGSGVRTGEVGLKVFTGKMVCADFCSEKTTLEDYQRGTVILFQV